MCFSSCFTYFTYLQIGYPLILHIELPPFIGFLQKLSYQSTLIQLFRTLLWLHTTFSYDPQRSHECVCYSITKTSYIYLSIKVSNHASCTLDSTKISLWKVTNLLRYSFRNGAVGVVSDFWKMEGYLRCCLRYEIHKWRRNGETVSKDVLRSTERIEKKEIGKVLTIAYLWVKKDSKDWIYRRIRH